MKDTHSDTLYRAATNQGGVFVAKSGALMCMTGKHTGRAPHDKFFVEDDITTDNIHWGEVNKSISEEQFNHLELLVLRHLGHRGMFSQDLFAGADDSYRLSVRVCTEFAWHALATRHLLIRPTNKQQCGFEPELTIFHAPTFFANPDLHDIHSEAFVIVNLKKRVVLIGGTSYFGEIKKAVFTAMNYLLPDKGVLPMHCSANVGPEGDTTLFFGLSGTGKTTLSADGVRKLIGDDEHGWSNDGIFNFEGGCYVKCANLSEEKEPEIWSAVNRHGTVIENATMDAHGVIDFDDTSVTENTRAAYPLRFLKNIKRNGKGTHPKNIVFLTCDAFGVLPPLARLTDAQALYHFLSGYTAKVAGTEQGVVEPQATFSACFGEPFMPRSPLVYAGLLYEKLREQKPTCWLLNTGWTGGPYGIGSRIDITTTRNLLEAALSGALNDVSFESDQYFGLSHPSTCPGVDNALLKTFTQWNSVARYHEKATELVGLFRKNFKRFDDIRPLEVSRF